MSIDDTATAPAAQDVDERIEQVLFGKEEPQDETDNVAPEDAELPEVDDTDSVDDEGSSDIDDDLEDQPDLSLADYLGIDEDRVIVDDNNNVSVVAIVDGEKTNVPLKDLVKSYQLQGHVNNKSMTFESQRREFEGQKAEIVKELETRVQGVMQLSKAAEQQLMSEFNGIDWDRLRSEDSAEWTALRQEFAERAQSIQRMQALAGQEAQRVSQERQAEFEKQRNAYLKQQMELMLKENPEWNDQEKLSSDMAAMRTFLSDSYGFSDEDMQHVTDHRLVKLIKDAKKYREGIKTAQEKKVKQVPRFQKPGAAKGNSASLAKARAVKAKREAVRKSGNTDAVANFLIDRM